MTRLADGILKATLDASMDEANAAAAKLKLFN
jgi:hypothetical protein